MQWGLPLLTVTELTPCPSPKQSLKGRGPIYTKVEPTAATGALRRAPPSVPGREASKCWEMKDRSVANEDH